MGIFDRMSRLIKGSANAKIDKMTDPAKELEQLILEMEEEIRKGRAETTKMMATQKRMAARIVELGKQSAVWSERAEAAVRAGDDELAKQALERRQETEEQLAEARHEEKEAARYAQDLQDSLKRNDARLREIKMKKGTIKAKVANRKGVDVSAEALDEFDRISGKVDDAESEVEAEAELADELGGQAKDEETEAKFVALAKKGGGDVDDRLAALKKKMAEKTEEKE